jgi:hypothetical protein
MPNNADYTEGDEMCIVVAEELAAEEGERLERARKSRRRYKQRQDNKDKQLQKQVENAQIELERLKLEHASLVSESHALTSLSSYTNSMTEALSAVVTFSASKACNFGDKVIEGVNTFCGWAKHHWVTTPTAMELIMGNVWRPTDDQLRWYLRAASPEMFWQNNLRMIDRLTKVLEEGKRSPEALKNAEVIVNFHIGNWVS